MSESSNASHPKVVSKRISAITLATIRQLVDTGADLKPFYADLHAGLSASPNVMISLTPQNAINARLDELKKIDPSRKRLPLYGVPYIAKDNIDAPPHYTTAACQSFAYGPSAPAHIIRELELFGAILLGKSNMDQFACGLVGTRSPYGIPLNPHNNYYIPGGSSSGSAVAVAMGLCAFSLGTDTAGSGRVPAAMNGVVGLKPTKGILSTRGVVPASETQDCVSIFANTVEDSSQVLALLASKADVMCTFCRTPPPQKLIPVECRLAAAVATESFQFGIPKKDELEFFNDRVSEESYNQSVSLLEKLGGKKIEIEFELFSEVGNMLYGSALIAERYAAMGQFLSEQVVKDENVLDESVRKIILGGGKGMKAHEVFTAQKRVRELALLTRMETWSKVDVLVVPSVPCVVTTEQVQEDPIQLNSRLGIYTNFVNLLDLCAVAVPAPVGLNDSGVPRGITIIGQAFEERIVLAIARKFEAAVATTKAGSTA